MAEGDMLSKDEACIIGEAVRAVWRARLAALPDNVCRGRLTAESCELLGKRSHRFD